jgi:hypothetical protein
MGRFGDLLQASIVGTKSKDATLSFLRAIAALVPMSPSKEALRDLVHLPSLVERSADEENFWRHDYLLFTTPRHAAVTIQKTSFDRLVKAHAVVLACTFGTPTNCNRKNAASSCAPRPPGRKNNSARTMARRLSTSRASVAEMGMPKSRKIRNVSQASANH